MKPDLPILGQISTGNSLLTVSLIQAEMRKIDANMKALQDRIKINELRKSCGVKDVIGYTINIRKAPRRD
jgi:hypothetical protein